MIVRAAVTEPKLVVINHPLCSPHTYVYHDLRQMTEKVEFMLSLTSYLSLLYSVKSKQNGAVPSEGGVTLTEDVQSLVTNFASNCILMAIEDVYGEVLGYKGILP